MTQTTSISYAEVERLYAVVNKRKAETDAAWADYQARRDAEHEARQAWIAASEDYFAA